MVDSTQLMPRAEAGDEAGADEDKKEPKAGNRQSGAGAIPD